MRKVVLDTNVLISGVIASGYSAAILDAAQREEIKLVTSAHLLEEFSSVISRRHIIRKYPKAAEHAEALLDFLRAFAILTTGIPTPNAKRVCGEILHFIKPAPPFPMFQLNIYKVKWQRIGIFLGHTLPKPVYRF
jgi:putative PIN family toxin of toxin-antitoxin system